MFDFPLPLSNQPKQIHSKAGSKRKPLSRTRQSVRIDNRDDPAAPSQLGNLGTRALSMQLARDWTKRLIFGTGLAIACAALAHADARSLASAKTTAVANGTVTDVSEQIFASSFEVPGAASINLASAQPPQGFALSASALPLIAVDIHDPSGLSFDRITYTLDGVDIEPGSRLGNDIIAYSVPQTLAVGSHRVDIQVGDAVGSWSFEVIDAPTVIRLDPNGLHFPSASQPPIEALITDQGAELVPASIQLALDGRTITDLSQLDCVSAHECTIRYLPPQPLAIGTYRIEVGADNTLGMAVTASSHFYVDPADQYVAKFLSPVEGATLTAPIVAARFQAGSNVTSVAQMTMNGQAAGVDGYADGQRIYAAITNLQPGANEITAVVHFENGQTRTVVRHVTFDAPPTVTVTSPSDWQSFGPTSLQVSGNSTNLTGGVERPISIVGTTSRTVAQVTINQQLAQLDANGRNFRFDNFFVHEGTNLISVNASDELQRVGSTQLVVYVDYTAPLLTIEHPTSGALTSAGRIDVRGVVNDAVEPGINALNPIVTVTNVTNARSVTARVVDRYYLASELPLEVGANVLRVTATDTLGNSRVQNTEITRIAAGTQRITLLAGDRQSGPINAELPQPLVVVAMDADGLPLVDLPIRFDVQRGAGSISTAQGQPTLPDGIRPARNLSVRTDASGRAAAWLTTGSEAGESSNMVRAWNDALAEDVLFTATGLRDAVHSLQIKGASGGQFAQTNSQPLEALTVIARDASRNPVNATPVVFNIVSGEAIFNSASAPNATVAADGQSIVALTDKDGLVSVRPHTGNRSGVVRIRAQAAPTPGTAIGSATFQLMVLDRRDGPTQFGGLVMDQTGAPLAGIRLSIARTSLSAITDAEGKFVFEDQVPAGKIDLFVDGRTAGGGNAREYPALHFETAVIQGQDNQLPHPIYLPAISHALERVVGGNRDVVLTVPGIEGFEMVVKANSVTFPDGSREGPVVVTAVNKDRLPMVAPGSNATFSGLGWTIQPTGTRFDPPIEVRIPNVDGMKPGETAAIVQWDHDLATFVPMGRGTVNESGTQIVTDSGSGITKAGWGGCQDCPPITPNDGDDECPNPPRRTMTPSITVAGKIKLTADGREDKLLKGIATLAPDNVDPDPAGTSVALLAEPLGDCGGLEITWDFADGTPTVTGTSITHKFVNAGNYNVTVTGRCTGCNETIDPAHIRVMIFKVKITAPAAPEQTLSNANPPVMPDIEFEATVTPTEAGPDLSYEWQMDTRFVKGSVRDDQYHFPSGGGVEAKTGDTGRKWKPEWGTRLLASRDIKVKVKAFSAETPALAATHEHKDFKILGDNPSSASINGIIGDDPYFLHRLVQQESSYHQFNVGGGLGGTPNFGPPNGFGIMQHDPANEDQVYSWLVNTSDGPVTLNAKRAIADVFWPAQVSQYDLHQLNPMNPRVPVHVDVDEGGAGCLFTHDTGHTFHDPIWIKAYNSATRHYMVWQNAVAATAIWKRNELAGDGRNYVHLVCNAVAP